MAQAGGKSLTSLAASLRAMSMPKRVVFLALAAAVTFGSIWALVWTSSPDFQVLYSSMDPADAAAVIEQLKQQKIPYRIGQGGTAILVPQDRVYELRLLMASQGLPQGTGIGFEIFDQSKLGMTQFVQNVNYQRALQGELARTIASMDEVETCRVHIVMPKGSLFLEQEEPASASVMLKLRGGKDLSRRQIEGMVQLVASSVPKLRAENVTVVDNLGRMLAGGGEGAEQAGFSSEQLEYQEKLERGLEQKIKTMLGAILGPGKSIVRVSCLLDFSREEKTAEQYQPEASAVRSEQYEIQRADGGRPMAMGVPEGVERVGETEKNIDRMPGGKEGAVTEQRLVNYEVSKVIRRIVEPSGKLKRVSAAVVVDGDYKWVEEKKGEGRWEYVPRTPEEINHIQELVKRVINFDPVRGDQVEVVNMPFETREGSKTQEAEVSKGWMERISPYLPYGKYLLVLFAIFLAYRMLLRPVVVWLTHDQPEVETRVLKQLPMTVKELEKGYATSGGSEAVSRRAIEAIERDRERSVEIMRQWLREQKT